ncbi:MAG: hypothetical protein EAZ85_01900 [Bacteroidetes bacterium]|nr:MAG: hypothetical protein EAZ85_01900 [Bacteroidota bacterium]TAG90393.1 MAG: hypothetical protein EAZ20_04500 [Bacteroidota bacterium]
MTRIYILCFLICILEHTQAQTITLKEKSMVTDKEINISISGGSRRDLATLVRPVLTTIYRRDVNGLGLHNPCVYDIMIEYGMKYDVVPEGQRISERKFSKHNRRANWKLFWRNGFFWKSKMHKKMKKCRIASGEQDLEGE